MKKNDSISRGSLMLDQIIKDKNNFNDLDLLRRFVYRVLGYYRKEKRLEIIEKFQDELLKNKVIPVRVSDSEDFYRYLIDHPIEEDPKIEELIDTLSSCYVLE